MAYTNIELVRKHLQESIRAGGKVEDHRIRLIGLDPVVLPHSGLIVDSERLKGKEQLVPLRETVILCDDAVSLSRSNLLEGTVVVAGGTSLTRIFTENVDFVVDYPAGKIKRTETGSIESGREVVVWYYSFTIYDRNVDYVISYQNGEVNRLENGGIADGQLIWVDYEIESGLFADDVIANAIMEASVQLEQIIDSAVAEGGLSVLTIAETYLTVSILAQIRALEITQSATLTASARASISSQLLEISTRYRRDCETVIKPYARKATVLAGPTRS